MKKVTDENFEAAESCKDAKLIEFFATWCPHCQRMMPIVEKLAKEYAGKIKFFLVDVDLAPDASAKYEVSGTPTFFLCASGKTGYETLEGEQPEQILKKELDKIAA
jgi:thioredoxin 1